MYTADRVFTQRLCSYDAQLSVRWILSKERWGIYRTVRPKGAVNSRSVLVHIVQNPDLSFRPLDERTMRHLKVNDMHRMSALSRSKHITMMEEASLEHQKAMSKSYKDEVQAISEEIAPQVAAEAEDVGGRNTPQEDAWAAMEDRYGEEKADEILS